MRNLAVFVGKRLLAAIPLVFLVSIFTFILMRALPASPVDLIAGPYGTPERLEYLTRLMGLDKPLVEQYVIWMGGVLHGDLGVAWHTGQGVTTDLISRIPASLELAMLSMLIAVPVGVVTGVISARFRDSTADFGLRVYALVARGAPEFLLGIFMIWVFFAILNWAPPPLGRIEIGVLPPDRITGLYTVDSILSGNSEALVSSLRSLALPVITLGLIFAGGFQRWTRATMIESLSSDAILAARGYGLRKRLIFYKYALKHSLLVVIPVFGLVVAYAIGGLVAIEIIFSWPGAGRYAIESARFADLNAVQGFVLFSVTLYVMLNLLVDVLQAVVDPRIEYR